jgi:hypothetical protein
MSNETTKPKKFWKSKTVLSAAIMLLTFVLDAAFQLGISDTVDSQLNALFHINEAGEVVKINWAALITLLSMLALRFATKKPITLNIKPGNKNSNGPGRQLLNALKDAKNKIQ